MNLKNKLEFIKKQDKNKSTIALLVFLSLVVLIAFSVSKTFNNFYTNNILKSYDYNYRSVGLSYPTDDYPDLRESMDKLKKVKYVKDVFSNFESDYTIKVIKIGDKKINGYAILIGKTEDELKELSNGNYKDKHSIICHKNYYPDIYHEVNNWIPRTKIISMKKGYKMQYQYYNSKLGKSYTDELNVVEVLNNDINMIDENVCYASREIMWEISQNEFAGIEQGVLWEDFLVDYDKEHYEEVNAKFMKMGFGISTRDTYDLDFSLFDNANKIKIILFIGSILIVGIFVLVFNKNKINTKIKSYGILKTIGLEDKEYNTLLDLESISVVIKSAIISFAIGIIIFAIKVIIRFIFPFFLMKINILFDWVSLIIYYLFVLILLCLSNYTYFKKIKKKSIVESIGD